MPVSLACRWLSPVFHVVFPLYESVSKSPLLIKDTSPTGLGPTLTASFFLDSLYKDPISK